MASSSNITAQARRKKQRVTAEIIHFDCCHPDFGDFDFGDATDHEYSVQVYRGGRFLGTVRSADGAQSWDAEWRGLGEFSSVDAAAAALIARANSRP